MTERTFRHVVVTRFNQGLAGEADGNTKSGARSNSCGSSLALTPFLKFIIVCLWLANLVGPLTPSSYAESIDACLADVRTPTPVTSVHIQPESGYQPVLDEIFHANCTIDLSMYFLTDLTIVDALEHAENRGIRVQVILEQEPYSTFGDQQEMFDRLEEIGAEVRWSPDEFTFSHAKYMLVDERVLLVTNQNFTGAGFNRNREFGVVTTDPGYVREANAIFRADWTGSEIDGEMQHLVVSPVNSRPIILDLINSSEHSIWMYAEVLRDEDVTGALSSAAERGVDVRILVNPTADEDDIPYFLDVLGHGVQVRVLTNPYVHSKVIIIDGSRALVESHNYSYTSLELNREIGIVLDDPMNLEQITVVYERDWSRAEPVEDVAAAP